MNIIKEFKLFCESRNRTSIDWEDLYKKAKETSGESFEEFEKEYSEILDVPHIKDALDKADDFDSFKKMVGKFEKVTENVNKSEFKEGDIVKLTLKGLQQMNRNRTPGISNEYSRDLGKMHRNDISGIVKRVFDSGSMNVEFDGVLYDIKPYMVVKDTEVNEKYKHTSEDKEQDMELIKEFANKFESEIGSKIELKELTEAKFKDYLGYGAEKIYRVKHNIKNEDYDSIDQYGMLWISTGINPHGVTKDGDTHRTFTIHFELKGKKTNEVEGEEYVDEVMVKKFHSYSAEMDDIINEFGEYIENEIR